jgi:hypothetical protein
MMEYYIATIFNAHQDDKDEGIIKLLSEEYKLLYAINPSTYEELKITIDNIIKTKINKEHLKNYFNYLFIQAQSYIESH